MKNTIVWVLGLGILLGSFLISGKSSRAYGGDPYPVCAPNGVCPNGTQIPR